MDHIFYVGDTRDYDVEAKRQGDPIDLTGGNVKLWLKPANWPPGRAAVLHLDCDVIDPEQGKATVQMNPNNTPSPKVYAYVVRVTEQAGRVTTIDAGTFTVKAAF